MWYALHEIHLGNFFNLSATTYLKKDRVICRLEKDTDAELTDIEKKYVGKCLTIIVKHGESGTKYINEIDEVLDEKLEGVIFNRERARTIFDAFLKMYKGNNQDPTFYIEDISILRDGKPWEIKKILEKEYDI